MAFQPTSVPFKLTPQDMGRPDFLSAISKGMSLGYQPQMTQAEIFNKIASPLATIASNPNLWAIMPQDQQQRVSQMIGQLVSGGLPFGNQPQQSIQQEQQTTMQHPSQNRQDTSSLNGAPPKGTQAYDDWISGNQNSNVGRGGSYGSQPSNQGQNLTHTQFGNESQRYNVPGSQGGVNPMSTAEAQRAGLQTTATTQAEAQTQTYRDSFVQAQLLASQLTDIQNNADKLHEAFSRLESAEKGPQFGTYRARSTAAQDTDQAANAVAFSLGKAQQQGYLTNEMSQEFINMKHGRTSTDENEAHMNQYIKGYTTQGKQLSPFLVKAYQLGIPQQEAMAIWQYYTTDVPFYNVKTHKMNEKIYNWEDYLSGKKYQEAFSPSARERVQNQYTIKNKNNISKIISNNDEENIIPLD